jgi:hypothetical protein
VAKVFIAYPSKPEITEVMRQVQQKTISDLIVLTWERPDLGGHELISPVISSIKECDFVAADITQLNFNVTYELGFALGLGKRVIPIRHAAYDMDADAIQLIGIFDTLVRQEYRDADELAALLQKASPGQRIATNFPPDPSPLYVVLPKFKVGDLGQIKERALRTGLRSRVYDPTETPRLGASEAVRSVAASTGVIIPVIAPDVIEASVHNIRAAFVAGVAHALEKQTLLIQHGHWPVPLDIRDDVKSYQDDRQLGTLISTLAGKVHDVLFSSPIPTRAADNLLAGLNLGDPSAENEEAQLEAYFLERGEDKQVADQRANIVVGRKGSGKTAVFVIVRDKLKADRSNVVLDLSPETHQLKRLKDLVLDCLAAGSKEFLLSSFWEYVLLLEIAQKLVDKDADVHKRNHNLFEPYQRLLAAVRVERC